MLNILIGRKYMRIREIDDSANYDIAGESSGARELLQLVVPEV